MEIDFESTIYYSLVHRYDLFLLFFFLFFFLLESYLIKDCKKKQFEECN